MAVQAPLFSDDPGLQDWMLHNNTSDPILIPFHVNQPSSSTHLFEVSPHCPQALSTELERQSNEIDLFLHFQSERLKHAIQEQKRQQISSMLISIESKASPLIRKAEHDLSLATARARKLEECLRRVKTEAEVWKRMANDNEAVITGLNSMLGQAQQERLNWASSQAQDAESACCEAEEDDKMGCKWCRKRVSCVVLLPCRHLCACRECGSFLEICPVCHCVTRGVIEVFMS